MTRILWKDREFEVKNLKLENGILSGTVNGETISLTVTTNSDGNILSAETKDGEIMPVAAVNSGEFTWVQWNGQGEQFRFGRGREGGFGEEESDGNIKAPMPGKILELMAGPGDKVEKDQVLVLMESMKLQVEIRCPFDGQVASCSVSVGEMTDGGTPLMEIRPLS